MSEPVPRPYPTGPLWAVLALLLLGGTVASAFVVFGLTDLFATGRWPLDLPLLVGGAFVASFLMLLLIGVLYRADRLRGTPHREVPLFE